MNVERHNPEKSQEMKELKPKKQAKGSVHCLPSKDYESLDYDVCYNKPFSKMLGSSDKMSLAGQNVMRWLVTFVIGVCTGLVAVFIDYFVKLLTKWKFDTLDETIQQYTRSGKLVLSLLLLMLFNGGFSFVAAIITAIQPIAAGSGIPEIKCYLNGVKVPNVVRLKTLVCKAVGVLFSVAGGLFVGKEGPMIHSGAVIGAGVPQFQSLAFKRIKFNFPYFRTDRDKRDFVSGGAAAGVAAAFGAPIGGVLFSLEEGSSFWNQALTWRTFFCSMSATFTLNFFLSGIAKTGPMKGWGAFYQPGLINFGSFECSPDKVGTCNLWTIQDLLIFIAMGFLGGLMGAWFNALNKDLTIHRMLHVQRGGKLVKVLEAVLIAVVTTCVAFFCPIYLGRCKPLSDLQGASVHNETKQYFCAEGQYNDMASLFFNSQETAIKQLFHNDGAFSLPSLAIFFICFYFLACWTYGAGVPSGLFVPCLLCGAAYGRFVAELLRLAGYEHTYNGTFSLIGAAAFLGGVVRMTISLTVILIESTNEISYGLPIMATLMVAKWSGDLFNEGLYDIHIKLKSVPLLEWAAPQKLFRLQAKDIMESCLSYIYPHTRVQSIVGILKTTAHNAFPVVTLDNDVSGGVSELDYQGNPVSSNVQYALSTVVRGVTSEQRQRSRTTASEGTVHSTSNRGLSSDRGHLPNQGSAAKEQGFWPRKSRKTCASDTFEAYSKSAPFVSFLKRGQQCPEDKQHLLHSEEQCSKQENAFPRVSVEEPVINTEVRENVYQSNPEGGGEGEETLPEALTLHGLILRSQLVTLLKNRIFHFNQVSDQPELEFANMTEDYPRYPDVHSLEVRQQDMNMIMDVTPYMNPCPYIVYPWTPVPLVFNLFRTMGLRHIVVVNKKGQLVGMITRYNLTEKYMEHCLEMKEANERQFHNS